MQFGGGVEVGAGGKGGEEVRSYKEEKEKQVQERKGGEQVRSGSCED